MTTQPTDPTTFDMRSALHGNRMLGIWRTMRGYRGPYVGATAALGASALAKTCTFLLLGYFADSILQ
ncbi:MAG: ABC transporter ATP-binding protein, partial [Anaerolineales bacterium]